jgi:hypothetical protein
MKHDALLERLQRAAKPVSLKDASNAFIASLGSAPKRYRPVLGHVAYATNLPKHAFTPSLGEQDYTCAICGATEEDNEIDDNEEYLAKGDTVFADVASAMADLESYAKLPRVTPTPEDHDRFDAMLAVLAHLPAKARATDLAKAWAPVVPRTNAYARAALVEIFGICGILETPDHPGHLTRWVGFWEYQELPSTNGDGRPPEVWWRREYGVNLAALNHVFPGKKFPATTQPNARPIADSPIRIPKKGKNAALELQPGDLLAIEYEKRWVAGVVLGAHVEGKKTLPVIEFYEGSWAERPTPNDLKKRKARLVGPFREGSRMRREPLALEEIELFGPVMPVRLERIAMSYEPPTSKDPIEPFRVVAARNLLYLLETLAVNR